MNKPNFFIIGAPKCGTTSLAAWLSEHANIFVSPVKEPHFFNRDGLYLTETIQEYEKLFDGASRQHFAIGECSTQYLYSREAVPKIKKYNPDAKFIVCIRNPIEMAPALHSERVWQGMETEKDFEKAWRLQAKRKEGKHIPRTIRKDPDRLQYGSYCRLGEQISRLYSHVAADRVLILILDDIAANPKDQYIKLLNFLDIPVGKSLPQFAIHNSRIAVRWPFLAYTLRFISQVRRSIGWKKPINLYGKLQTKLNAIQPSKSPVSGMLSAELREYFEDDIHVLERLLGRDFSSWLGQ